MEVIGMARCRACRRKVADGALLGMLCGRCEKIQGDVMVDLAAELRANDGLGV